APAQQIAETAGGRITGITAGRIGAAQQAAENVAQSAAGAAAAALIGAIGEQAEQQHDERRHAAASALPAPAENLVQQTHCVLLCFPRRRRDNRRAPRRLHSRCRTESCRSYCATNPAVANLLINGPPACPA